ncbi:TPA: AAA family ATPase [Escherichia coli]|uniref:AAA family ATPase n=1 Tax=Escherichia coli TaxID=562 RepID=UPI001F0F94DC|nr:AAA family ATPase [Escherichia coli]MCH4624211.1 AAA family ATPase [Escherichia coli]MCT4757611.1 AAA family ATPase [Escherichia coli]MCV8072808.1 AAA family ATPase [Escherichia coli]MCV8106961.1 AAA family ATPase [Escherichia coli]MDA5215983.1 AAA family ATPase [Escherichia coli]
MQLPAYTRLCFIGGFMVNVREDELFKLIEQGIKGNANAFTLLCRKMINNIRKNDEALASKLASLVAEGTVLRGASSKAPMPVDGDSRRNLLQETSVNAIVEEPVWNTDISKKLESIVNERENAVSLFKAGLEPVKTVLLSGPPGVGKTMSAHWLAAKLNLPLLTLDLSSVMSSLLGKTGNNIKSVMDYAKEKPCVLLLDEFDAVAKRRDDDRDVGELKRLVTVLLQTIDEWPATSLLVAATNHPDILDPAVWRRFEHILKFNMPSVELIDRYLVNHNIEPELSKKLAPLLDGMSFAIINRILNFSKKNEVLRNIPFESSLIEAVITERVSLDEFSDNDLNIIKYHFDGFSNRKIAELVGVSHPTIANKLQKWGIK